ncbi:MAG: hypothetical protein FWC94_01420 [Bacteroidales bacterium]|nr:hypothetical protein [Bacteroidales bacterium]
MSESPTPQTQTESKEIDLIDVVGRIFTGIGHGIRGLFMGLLHFLRFTKKHFWVLLILAILGGGGGYLREHLRDPFFQSEMLAEVQLIPSAQIVDRFNSLNLLIRENNPHALATVLSIPVNKAENLLRIHADNIEQERIIVSQHRTTDASQRIIIDTITEEFVRIQIRVSNHTAIDNLEQSLVSFIENEPFIEERLTVFRRNNLLMQEAIETEIEQLREFQRINIERSPLVMIPGNMPLMIQNQEETYVAEILELQDHLLELQRGLMLTRPLTVIQPFLALKTPANRTLFNIMLSALFAIAVGYVVLLLRQNWKHL